MKIRITEIKKKEGKKEEFILVLSEGTEIRLLPETYFRSDLTEGSEWDIEYLKELEDNDLLARSKNEILGMLDYRMRTTSEVREKLLKMGYREEIAEKAIDEIKSYGYLDDEKYTNMYIKEKVRFSGKNRILNDLRKKGLDRNITDEIFSTSFRDDEKESCMESARKKYRQLKGRSDNTSDIRNRLFRFLISRGYEYDLIRDVYSELKESEDFTDSEEDI